MALDFKRQLAYRLGYSSRDFDSRYTSNPLVIFDYSVDDQAYIQTILDRLTAMDAELDQNRQDSMATELSGVKVDFQRNILVTLSEGSRALHELERISGVQIKYDKYKAQYPGQSSNQIAIRNYS